MTPFLRDYTKLAAINEAPEVLYLWSIVSGVAALLSRRVYLPFGNGRINPNLYIMIVGDPGTRKSSAIKEMKRRLKAVGYSEFCGDKVTMQKFLCDLAGVDENGESGEQKEFNLDSTLIDNLGLRQAYNETEWVESFIAQDEFSDFMGVNNYGFIALLGGLWDIDEPYEYRLKNSKSLLIPRPLINILGGTTPEQFNTIFPAAIAGQGFLSRLVIVSAAPTGKQVSWPEANDPEHLARIDLHLSKIRKLEGAVTVSQEVRYLLDCIYKSWGGIPDARFATYATRRHSHLLKLVMVMAATRLTTVLSPEDVIMANTLLTYTERHMPNALGAFGKQEDSDVANMVIEILKHAKKPLAVAELYKHVSQHIIFKGFRDLMGSLLVADKVQQVEGKFLPIKKPVQQASDAYVDWQLLKGIAPDLLF